MAKTKLKTAKNVCRCGANRVSYIKDLQFMFHIQQNATNSLKNSPRNTTILYDIMASLFRCK